MVHLREQFHFSCDPVHHLVVRAGLYLLEGINTSIQVMTHLDNAHKNINIESSAHTPFNEREREGEREREYVLGFTIK